MLGTLIPTSNVSEVLSTVNICVRDRDDATIPSPERGRSMAVQHLTIEFRMVLSHRLLSTFIPQRVQDDKLGPAPLSSIQIHAKLAIQDPEPQRRGFPSPSPRRALPGIPQSLRGAACTAREDNSLAGQRDTGIIPQTVNCESGNNARERV